MIRTAQLAGCIESRRVGEETAWLALLEAWVPGSAFKEVLVNLTVSKVGASNADAQPAAKRPCRQTAAWQA